MVEINKEIPLTFADPVALDVVDKSSGEIISINATPVTIIPMVKFKTNFTDNTVTNDAEYNNKPYEIDDSMYVPLKDLLKMAERQKVPLKLVETFDGLSDEEVIQAINQDGESVSVVSSNDDISSDVSTVKSEETSNLEISEPDAGTASGEE